MYTETRSFKLEMDSTAVVIALRTTTITLKNGVPVGPGAHHRVLLGPYADLDTVIVAPGVTDALPEEIKTTIQTWWTPERIAQYEAAVVTAKAAIAAAAVGES